MSTYDELAKLEADRPTLHPVVFEGNSTRISTQLRDMSRDSSSEKPRDRSSGKSRKKPRNIPGRDEVQELSFRLRDQLKVKVQAEVPHRWKVELEDMAAELKVKKLELYRFILGEFLGKVKRKPSS